MATVTRSQPETRPVVDPIPKLQNGDHLTREEFERRYEAAPSLKKAELIDGVVHMPSPVRHTHHGKQHFDTITWLGHYVAATRGIEGGDNGSLRLDLANEPQPDAYLIILPELGGQAKIDEDGYIVGGPELVDEVSASSASYDLHEKLRSYRRNGVREYVVWRVEDKAIDWFIRKGDQFEALPTDGIYKSLVFPGLWLDARALIEGDLTKVFQVLDQGLATKEHTEFVQQLKQKRDQLAQ